MPGEVFETEGAEGAATAAVRPPVAILALLLAAGVAAAVVALQPTAPQALPPAPADSGVPSVTAASTPVTPLELTWVGFDEVRLGMPADDFQFAHRDLSGWDSTLRVPGRDRERGCIQYAISSRTGPTVWVWSRDDRIVTVGIDQVGTASTSFGIRLGDPFSRDDVPPDWAVDDDAGILVARGVDGATLATLADTDSDGLLDYATVALPPGDECELDPSSAVVARPSPSGLGELDGLTLDGVGAVGAVVTDVTPSSPDDWFGAAAVTLAGGCPTSVQWQRAPGFVAGIDRPVWADAVLGPPVITDTVATAC